MARNTEFHLGRLCVWQGEGFDNSVSPAVLLKLLMYSMLEAVSPNVAHGRTDLPYIMETEATNCFGLLQNVTLLEGQQLQVLENTAARKIFECYKT